MQNKKSITQIEFISQILKYSNLIFHNATDIEKTVVLNFLYKFNKNVKKNLDKELHQLSRSFYE